MTPNQLAKMVVDLSTGQVDDASDSAADNLMSQLGRGLKGGPVRADTLTSERRTEIARQAAEARWRKNEDRS